jgi:NADH dehydrogenase
MRELVTIALGIMGRRRFLVPIPFAMAQVQARLFELMPNPPLTTGQVDLLKSDNVASKNLPGLRELGIDPKPVEEIVPNYLGPSHARP